eukprot:gene19278-21204_t
MDATVETPSRNGHPILVDVDQFVQYIGEFGKKQIWLQIMFCLMIMPSTFQTLLLTFVANNPQWRCTGVNSECNQTGVSFGINHDFYDKRCTMQNRSSWEFIKPKKFSIVTERLENEQWAFLWANDMFFTRNLAWRKAALDLLTGGELTGEECGLR